MTLLEVSGITVRYKQLVALRKLSMKVEQGETVFVTGPNGAGKSTLLKAIAGVVTPREGLIAFNGTQIGGKTPEDIARMGFSMVPEGREVFGGLTIEENLRLGTGMRTDKDQAARDLEQVYAVFPMLKDRKDQAAGVLSGGQQQMLVIGRALMARPRLILLDEPSLGLAPLIVAEIFELVARLRDQEGIAFLVVEQNAKVALRVADHGYVLENGRIVLEGSGADLRENEDIKEFYLGMNLSGHGKSFRDALIEDYALGLAPDMLFELLSYITGGERRRKAKALAKGEDPDGDAAMMDVLQALEKFAPVHPDPEAFLECLEPLQPRLYSISSSPLATPGELHLTVDAVRYDIAGRRRLGVASTFLADRLAPGARLKVYLQKAHGFGLPADPATPIIMVGPGTGIAPFRSFLWHRAAQKAPGKAWLFFGHQHEATDFFYRDELGHQICEYLRVNADGKIVQGSANHIHG